MRKRDDVEGLTESSFTAQVYLTFHSCIIYRHGAFESVYGTFLGPEREKVL